MNEEKSVPGETEVIRLYEQPSDAVSFYSDLAQIIGTGNEIILQFYETIPSPPGPKGNIPNVRTRLRATVTVSMPHARNLGNLLLERVKEHK